MNVKKKTTVEKISESEKTALYSISFENDGTTEFEKFVEEFEQNAKYNRDYQRIIAALQAILNLGALERFFRPEGKIKDSVAAIPIEGGKLRLYCLRISEQIVILGNGGERTQWHRWCCFWDMRNKQDWFNAKLSSVSPEIRTEIQLSADIIARIDSILKEKNMSQRDLARKMGKSEAVVSRWTTGFPNLTLRSIAELSTALGEPLIQVTK